MVKADPRRNYYADLELSPNASNADVKKQYRKLALLYHPDRNPGKEQEYNPKFQAIQVAHEVLADPEQKTKYDNDRRKLGFAPYPRPNVPPRNPYNVNPYAPRDVPWPPPPQRRPQHPPAPKPAPAGPNPPAGGANRYSQFRPPPPNAPRPTAPQAAQARASAWEQMNHSAKPGPWPPRPQASPSDRSTASDQEGGKFPRAKTNWEAWEGLKPNPNLGRSNTTRAPPPPKRPGGFDPTTPGADEAPAGGGTGGYFTSRHTAPPRPPPPQHSATGTPLSRPSTAEKADPLTRFRSANAESVPFSEGNTRDHRPYAGGKGEKLYIPRPEYEFRRTSSVQDHTKINPEHSTPNGKPPRSTRGRHRSASPLRKDANGHANGTSQSAGGRAPKAGKPAFFMGYDSSDSSDDESGGASEESPGDPRPDLRPSFRHIDPSQRPKAQPGQNWRRQNAGSSQDTQNTVESQASNGSAPASANGKGHRSTNSLYGNTFHSAPNSFDNMNTEWSNVYPFGPVKQYAGAPKPPFWAIPSSVTPPKPPSSTGSKREDSDQGTCPPQYAYGVHEETTVTGSTTRMFADTIHSSNSSPQIFTSPSNPAATPNHGEFRSRSTENINTRFAQDAWSGRFEGNRGLSAAPPVGRRGSRPRSSHPTHVPYATQSANVSGESVGGVFSDSATTMPPPPRPTAPNGHRPNEVRFSAEEWSKTFNEATLFQPQPGSKSGSPTRPGSQSARRGSRARPRPSSAGVKIPATKPKAASVADSVDETDELANSDESPDIAARETSEDGSAMDIDTDLPRSNRSSRPSSQKEPRNVSIPPLRTDWQDKPGSTSSAGGPAVPPPPPGPPPVIKNFTHKPVSGSTTPTNVRSTPNPTATANSAPTTATGLDSNLSDFKNVAPFTSSNKSGLSSLSDLTTNLPFQSGASASHPTKSFKPQKLALPQPPKPPAPPQALTQAMWHQYLAANQAYMRSWTEFNKKMLNHFKGRQAQMEAFEQREVWMVGDAFSEYMQSLREDEKVNAHWNVAKEKHMKAMMLFEKVRDGVVAGGNVAQSA